MRQLFTVAVALAACSAPASSSGPSPGGGAPYPMVEPGPQLSRLAADFTGSCAFARPGPDASHYTVALRVTSRAAVRDSAEFSGADNRMGTVAAGAHLAGEGPLAGGRGAGAGYGVVVRDPEGRVCRGYVAASDVAVDKKRARGRTR